MVVGDEKAGVILDSQTVITLFQQLGGVQATNQTILGEIQKLNVRLDAQETKFMPREEVLSRLREMRASTIISVIALAMSALELWHWLTSH